MNKKTKTAPPIGYDPEYFKVDKKSMYEMGNPITLEEIFKRHGVKQKPKAA